MTLWIAWSMLTSGLLAGAAAAFERAGSSLRGPRRFVWIAAILATTTAPAVLATRHASIDERRRSSAQGILQPDAKTPAGVSAQDRSLTTMSIVQSPSMTARQRANRLGRRVGDALAAWPDAMRLVDRWLGAAWLLASVGMILGFVREVVRLRRRQSTWSSVGTEFGDVLVAPDVGPAVVGFLRPRIVVPPWTLSADRTTRGLLLRHELEHIRAGDTRVLFLAELALIVVPWNAALWWMTRRLRLAIELDCDARVVRAVGDAHEYGVVLLSVGELYAAGQPLATSFSASRLHLEVRIDAMTAPHRRHPVAAATPFAAITLGVLATAAWMPRPSPLVPPRAAAPAVAPPVQRKTVDVHSSLTSPPVLLAAPHRVIDSPAAAAPLPAATPYRSAPVSAQGANGAQEPRVTVSFENSPIDVVLDVFARHAHRRIIAAANVSGTVTGTAVDQPWRSALRSLLNANHFDFTVGADSSLIVDTVDGAPRANEVAQSRTARDSTLASVGYAARKQSASGFFVDGGEIDRQAGAFSEMMRIVPGFHVAPSADGRAYVISDAQNSVDGCVNFFVDGALWQTITPGDIDTAVRPAQVVAVEAYRSSSTPSQFVPRDTPRCATIIVWTRARVRPDQVRLPK